MCDTTAQLSSTVPATSPRRRTIRGPKFVSSSDEEYTSEAPQLRKKILRKKHHDRESCDRSAPKKMNDQRFQAKTDFDEGNTGVAEPNGSSAADESRRLCGIVFLSFAKFDAAGRSISPLMHLEKMLVDGFGYDVDEASRVLDDVQRSYYIDDSGRRFVVRFRTPKVADEVMSQANKLSDYKPHGRHVAIEHVMNKKQTDDKRVLLRAMKILRRCGKFASLEWTGRLGYVLNCDNLKFVSTLSFGYPFCVFHIDCLNIHSY